MRILHLLASPVFSGPAEAVRTLALAQRAAGHQVHVAIDRKRAGLGSEESAAPRFAEAALLDTLGLELSTQSSPLAVLRDARILRQSSLDVVHAHFSHDHWVARLGTPRGAVRVRSIHAPRSLGRSTPRASAFTVPYAALLERAPAPAMVLPALVDARFQPSSSVGELRVRLGLAGSPLVGMVSTFQASRRHAVGLQAFAQLRQQRPQATLVLVGDGLLEPALRAQVADLGLTDSVRFVGYRSGAAFVAHLQALDEVWIMGLGNDWSARAAVQARACGVRVLAVAEGALPVWADAVLSAPVPSALVAASLAGGRRAISLPDAGSVADSVLALYRAVGARS